MRDLPTGTVTFMFTDVEGSTRLLSRLGARYRELQDLHYDIVRTAVTTHGGHEVDTEGDSFFVAFTGAAAAVAAAVDIQRAMAAAQWPDGATVRLRIGLHAGTGDLTASGYVGLDVNRAARISAAAHGGQVLVSDAVCALARGELPPGAHLRDLGLHRLKDFPEPERLHQVVVGGLEQHFPAPATVGARFDNLPTALDDFVGRGEALARVDDLLHTHRLVTLTGVGGTGKTRLAVEVARRAAGRYDDGVCFVDLSTVVDPEAVPARLVAALGLRQEAGQHATEVLAGHLHGKQLLLVLDNLEQVVEAAPFVAELLGKEPGLVALVTSRIALHVAGEQEVPVPPLTVPPSTVPDSARSIEPDGVADSEAVALLVGRAAAHVPGFRLTAQNAEAIAEITRRLDGLPLAIELAASWIRTLPPHVVLTRLSQHVSSLSSRDPGLPERQRTLRSTIDWSHDLLAPADQQLFRRLAVFAGSADLAGVEAVGDPGHELDVLESLATLVDHNLVRRTDTADGEPRFGMLETIREYGLERLDSSGDAETARRHHALHFLDVVERAADLASETDQVKWIRALEPDQQNFRSALRWCLRSGEAEIGLRLGVALVDAYRLGGRAGDVSEGVTLFEQLLRLPGAGARTVLRARALTALADLAWVVTAGQSLRDAEEAVDICRELGATEPLPQAMSQLGWARLQNGDPEGARLALEEAVELHLGQGDRHRAAVSSIALGILAVFHGRNEEARATYAAALSTFQELGDSYYAGLLQLLLGGVDNLEGSYERAQQRYLTALSAYLEIDNATGVSWSLGALAEVAGLMGHADAALRLAGASDRLRQGASLPALASAVFGDKLSRAWDSMDAGRADEIYQQGRAMQLDEAAAYALQPDSW